MRLIDADAVKLPKGFFEKVDNVPKFHDWLDEQPTIEPKRWEWIPIKSRPMDEEERIEWSERLGYDIEYEEAVIYVSQLPDDGEEVLTCDRYGTIRKDTFSNDPDYGCYFEENGDMDGIVAWMPLPEPYKEEQDGNNVRESNS